MPTPRITKQKQKQDSRKWIDTEEAQCIQEENNKTTNKNNKRRQNKQQKKN